MSFLNDKTTELRTALHTGDQKRATQVLIEAIAESGETFETTVQTMTDIDRQQQNL